MFSKVSVLVPTRQRPERLRAMIASFEETTRGVEDSVELVFRVDEDDDTTLRVLLAPLRYDVTIDYDVIIGPRYNGYASMPAFFNEMARNSTGDVLLLGNDDMLFKTPGWPNQVLSAANQHPDGVFVLGYSTFNATHYPFSTISRRVVEHVGFFWPPHVFWGDIFWRDVMGAFGRTVMLSDVEIEHRWVGFDPEPDQVFRDAEPAKCVEVRDPTYWSVTHANAVAETVEKLRPLVVTNG